MNKITVKSKIVIALLFCLVLSVMSVGVFSFGGYFSAVTPAVVAETTELEGETPSDPLEGEDGEDPEIPTEGEEGETPTEGEEPEIPTEGEEGEEGEENSDDPVVEESTLTESWEEYVSSDDYSGVISGALGSDGSLSDGIDGPKDLLALNSKTSGTYKLNQDIDLSGKIWSPVGVLNTNVTVDGQGYTIKGLTINSTVAGASTTYGYSLGLFGTVNGTIQNLYMKGVILKREMCYI